MSTWFFIALEVAGELKNIFRENPRVRRVGALLSVAVVMWLSYKVYGWTFTNDFRRFQLSGTVTYHGEPVPQGTIAFTAVKKGRQYSGYAGILGGRFDTQLDGRGHVGGRHTITIIGFGQPDADGNAEEVAPAALFEPTEFVETLPHGTAELDIKMPFPTR